MSRQIDAHFRSKYLREQAAAASQAAVDVSPAAAPAPAAAAAAAAAVAAAAAAGTPAGGGDALATAWQAPPGLGLARTQSALSTRSDYGEGGAGSLRLLRRPFDSPVCRPLASFGDDVLPAGAGSASLLGLPRAKAEQSSSGGASVMGALSQALAMGRPAAPAPPSLGLLDQVSSSDGQSRLPPGLFRMLSGGDAAGDAPRAPAPAAAAPAPAPLAAPAPAGAASPSPASSAAAAVLAAPSATHAQAFLLAHPAAFDWLRSRGAITRSGARTPACPLNVTDADLGVFGADRVAVTMGLAAFGFIVD